MLTSWVMAATTTMRGSGNITQDRSRQIFHQALTEAYREIMDGADLSPLPHHSWLGYSFCMQPATAVVIEQRQVVHALAIGTAGAVEPAEDTNVTVTTVLTQLHSSAATTTPSPARFRKQFKPAVG